MTDSVMRENIKDLDPADHIGRDLIAMQREQDAASGPEKKYKPAALVPSPGAFLFRSRVRQTAIKLRVFQENPKYNSDDNRQYKNNWEKNAQRNWGTIDPKTKKVKVHWKDVLAPDLALFNEHGITEIQFRPIPGLPEGTFTTRDPEIAAYIRLRLNEPDLAAVIYEEVGPTMAQLPNGEWVEVLPASDEARRQMAAAAAGV